MQIFEYAINLICAPYAFPFSVQLFLGDVPTNVNFENYSSTQPWIGEQHVVTAPQVTGLVNNAAAAVLTTGAAPSLSDDYTKRGIKYSLPISRPLNQRIRLSPSNSLDKAICSFLAEKLNWITVRPFVGVIHDAPIRLWVDRREVKQVRDGNVTFGKPEIIWSATRNKTGGLQPGELPQLEHGDQ